MEKGKRWDREISTQLEKSQLGIICLTPENRDSPWIQFEGKDRVAILEGLKSVLNYINDQRGVPKKRSLADLFETTGLGLSDLNVADMTPKPKLEKAPNVKSPPRGEGL